MNEIPEEELRDILPPVDPGWLWTWPLLIAIALLLITVVLAAWLLIRFLREEKPPEPPPVPNFKAQALEQLEEARKDAASTDPYHFSIRVSDILRHYIVKQYQVNATQQTSIEFLEAVQHSPLFTDRTRALLAEFLDKCDAIKFARAESTTGDNVRLVEQAIDFVSGEASARVTPPPLPK